METRQYNPGNCRTGQEFLRDVCLNSMYSDLGAQQRLGRHMQEESIERPHVQQRAVGTSAFVGLTVPQYLTDLYAPAVAAMRPFADLGQHHDLPQEGMTVNISKITTATSAALQASQNAAVSETNAADTLLTVPVQTIAGQQTVSRQAVDRGTGIDEVLTEDLMSRYATTLDATMIQQATTGLSAVARTTTYTDASPTAALLWPTIFQSQSLLEQTLLGRAVVDSVVMHSRRWNWLCAQVGTSFPFMGSNESQGQGGRSGGLIVTNQYGDNVRGVLSNGLKVYVDNNVFTNLGGTTNQDEIYIVASREIHVWEDPAAPLYIRAEQPLANQLSVLLVVYGYFAFTSRYANNPGHIFGTGTVAPAGF
jgi:hypothetical protein